MDLKAIENKYKPLPFWSWNERLDTNETARQIKIMNASDMGGFFMHARGGLKTEYMSEEWFENVKVGIKEAKKYNMEAWAYDENGYPSGFGDGKVNGLGEEYQQKLLRYERVENSSEKGVTICEKDGYRFYYEINPFYVDLLNPKTTEEFIKNIYQPYYDKFKDSFEGFFTDEPNIAMADMPWSGVICEEYQKRYNEDIKERLIELFENVGSYEITRIKFRKLITDLFSENYFKKIYDWCNSHNLKLTGHILLEESVALQADASGASMPHYEYFHIPGVDRLSNAPAGCLLGKQVGSVAAQLGKKQVLTESFACGGHELNFSDMRKILESQMIRGVNRFCSHLEGYSLRGERKRDHPPAMYYQQPWWDEYGAFCVAMSRIGKILAEGEETCEVLLIHPMTKVWSLYNGKSESAKEISDKFTETVETLEKKHILFHLGDETIIERHGKIENDKFVIGEMKYSKIIVLYDTLFDNTKKLLSEFAKNGGKIIKTDEINEIRENPVTDNENLTYTMRSFMNYKIHYFANITDKAEKAKIFVGSKKLNIMTGEWTAFDGEYEFQPYDSLIVMEHGESQAEKISHSPLKALDLKGEWQIENSPLNLYTLDFCKYSIDGILQEERGFVLNVLYRAMKQKSLAR